MSRKAWTPEGIGKEMRDWVDDHEEVLIDREEWLELVAQIESMSPPKVWVVCGSSDKPRPLVMLYADQPRSFITFGQHVWESKIVKTGDDLPLPELKDMSIPQLMDEVGTVVPAAEDHGAFLELSRRVRQAYPDEYPQHHRDPGHGPETRCNGCGGTIPTHHKRYCRDCTAPRTSDGLPCPGTCVTLAGELEDTRVTAKELKGLVEGAAEAFDSIHSMLALSSKDWSVTSMDAWLYGIVCGWDGGLEEDPPEDAMAEMVEQHGWVPKAVERLRHLHKSVKAVEAMRPERKKDHG